MGVEEAAAPDAESARWQAVLDEERAGKFEEVRQATLHEEDKWRELLKDLGGREGSREIDKVLFDAAQMEMDALERNRGVKEIAFDSLCKSAFEGGRSGGLARLRDRSVFFLLLQQEAKEAHGRARTLEGNVGAAKRTLAELRESLEAAQAGAAAARRERDAMLQRKSVVRRNVINLHEGLQIRRAAREREFLEAEQARAALEKQVGQVLKAERTPKQLLRGCKGDIARQVERLKHERLAAAREEHQERVAEAERRHAKVLERMELRAKQELDELAGQLAKQIGDKHSCRVEQRKRALSEARARLHSEQAAVAAAQARLRARKEVARRLAEAEAAQRRPDTGLRAESAQLARARETLRRLWSDNPALLVLGRLEHANEPASDATDGARCLLRAQALREFLETAVLPHVPLPSEPVRGVLVQCSDQLRELTG